MHRALHVYKQELSYFILTIYTCAYYTGKPSTSIREFPNFPLYLLFLYASTRTHHKYVHFNVETKLVFVRFYYSTVNAILKLPSAVYVNINRFVCATIKVNTFYTQSVRATRCNTILLHFAPIFTLARE